MKAPLHEREAERLQALSRYHVLDTPAEAAFDDLTRTIAHVCHTPIAAITLVVDDRHWCKSQIGFDQQDTPIDFSFCAHAILEPEPLVIGDTTKDERFVRHPMVVGAPFLRFYAGAALETPDGWPIGTLCVLDYQPRDLADPDLEALKALARQVMVLMELGRANAEQAKIAKEKDLLLNELQHRVKNNLQMIESLLALQIRSERSAEGRDALQRIQDRLRPLLLIDRQLQSDDPLADVDLAAFLDELCRHLVDFHGGAEGSVDLEATLEPLMMSRDRAVSIGLIVNEFVTNSFKHAFTKRGGKLSVTLQRDADHVLLALADDGPGLHPEAQDAGIGLRLIPALAEQLQGEVAWQNGAGTRLKVTW
jgi:two-component sensor histidine kinase